MIRARLGTVLSSLSLLLASLSPSWAVQFGDPFGEWQPRTRFPGVLSGVAYGNGTFVTVGWNSRGDGVVLTSSDAAEWTQQADVPGPLNAIAFGVGKFVAVGGLVGSSATNIVLVSNDGVQWTAAGIGGMGPLQSVVFGNGVFVALAGGAFFASDDGVRWAKGEGSIASGYVSNTLAFGNGKFVAVGDGKVATSTNGLIWSNAKRVTSEDLYATAGGNGLFVAAGQASTIFRSQDGDSWTSRTLTVGGSPVGALVGLAFGNETFVLVGYGGGYGALYTSSDGLQWTERSSRGGGKVGFANGMFFSLGDAGGIATSLDGVTWTIRRSNSAIRLTGLTLGNGAFIAVGFNTGGFPTTTPAVLRSGDGTNWVRAPIAGSEGLSDIAYGDGTLVAVGGAYPYSTSKSIFTSKDGSTWTRQLSDTNGTLNSIAWGKGTFVTVGHKGRLLSSPDGTNWNQTLTLTSDNMAAVAYGNGNFVAVGGPGYTSSAIYTSSNGVAWTRRDDPARGNILTGVTFGNGTFLAVRWFGPYLTSRDGLTWTPHDVGGGYFTGFTVSYMAMGPAHYVNGWFIARHSETTEFWISANLKSWQRLAPIPGSTSIPGKVVQNQRIAVAIRGETVWQSERIRGPFAVSLASSPFASESGSDVGSFAIRRSGPLDFDLPVNFSVGGTAENGIDYEGIAGGALMLAGQDALQIPVRARLDSIQEGVEEVQLTLVPGEAYEIVGSPAASVFIGESSHVPRFRPAQVFRLADGTVSLTVELPPTGTYLIEGSNNLNTWQQVGVLPPGPGVVQIQDSAAAGRPQRFYRARQEAP